MSFRPFFRGGRGGAPMRGADRGRPFHRPSEGHPFIRRPDEGRAFHGADEGHPYRGPDEGRPFRGREGRPFRGRDEGRGRGAYHRPDESYQHSHQDEGGFEDGFGARESEFIEEGHGGTEEVAYRGPNGRGFGQFSGRGSGFAQQQRPLLRPPGLLGAAPEGTSLLGPRPDPASVSHPPTRPFRGSVRGARFSPPPRASWRGGTRPNFNNQRSQDYKSPERTPDEPPVKKAREDSVETKPTAGVKIEEPKTDSAAKPAENTVKGSATKPEEKKPEVAKTPDRKPEEKGPKGTPQQKPAPQEQKTPQSQKATQEPLKKTPQQEKTAQEQQKTPLSQQKTQQGKTSQTPDAKPATKTEQLKPEIKKPDPKQVTQDRDRSSAQDRDRSNTRDSRDSRDRSKDSRDYRDSRDRDRDRRGRDSGRDDRSRGSGRDSRDYRDNRSRDYISSRDQPRSRHDSRDRDYKRSSDQPSSDSRKKSDSNDNRTPVSQRRPVQDRDWTDRGLEEPEVEPSAVCLDFYNSDLNLKLDKDCYAAHTFNSPSGFCFCWGGGRATYGFTRGKVCYEVRIVDNLPVDFGPLDHKETDPHVVRVGWSTDATSFQLGEEPDSFGFDGTGKSAQNSKFQDYGQKFGKGDVIIAMLDLMAKPPNMSYAKNGRWLGVAFPLRNWAVGDPKKALFPHILSKNCRFEVNFGQREPFFRPPPGFTYVGKVPAENRVRGTQPPPTKADCEMIMIVGLPGAGKTTWAIRTATENPEKHYNIIGTDTLIDKMKVMGLPRKHNYQGRWEVLVQLAADCLNKLFEAGSVRRRNYILDQTNVNASGRKRKLKFFTGFKRRCAVLQPTDIELERRSKKRTDEDGKYVPNSAVMDMKKNYTLPSDDDPGVEEIIWIEHRREAAQPIVDMYNKQAASSIPDKPASVDEKLNAYDRHSVYLRTKPDEQSPVPSSRQRDQVKEERSDRPPWQRKQDDRRPYQRDKQSDDRDRSRSPMRRDGRGPPNQDRFDRQHRDNTETRALIRDKPSENVGRPERPPQPLIKEERPWQQGNNRQEPWNRDHSDRPRERERDSKDDRSWMRDRDRQAPWERNQGDRMFRPDERGPGGGPRRPPSSDNTDTEHSGPLFPAAAPWQRDNRRPPGQGVGPHEKENVSWQEQDQKPLWQRDQGQPPQRQPWQHDRPVGPDNRGAPGLLGSRPGEEFHDGRKDLIKEEPMDIDPEDIGQYGFDEHGRPMPKPLVDDMHGDRGLMGRGRGLLPQPKGNRFGGPDIGPNKDMVPQREGRPGAFGRGRPPPEFVGSAGRGSPMERRQENFPGGTRGQFGEQYGEQFGEQYGEQFSEQYGEQERFDQPYGNFREEGRPAWGQDRDAFDASEKNTERPRPGMNKPPFEGRRDDRDIRFQAGPDRNSPGGPYDTMGQEPERAPYGHPAQPDRIPFDRPPEQPVRGDPDQRGAHNRYEQSLRGPYERPGSADPRPADVDSLDRPVVPDRGPYGPAGSFGRGRDPHEKPGILERGPLNRPGEQRGSPYNRFSEPREKSPYDRCGPQQDERKPYERFAPEGNMSRPTPEREPYGLQREPYGLQRGGPETGPPFESEKLSTGRQEQERGMYDRHREGQDPYSDSRQQRERDPYIEDRPGERGPPAGRGQIPRGPTGSERGWGPGPASRGASEEKPSGETYGQETWEGGYQDDRSRGPGRDQMNRNWEPRDGQPPMEREPLRRGPEPGRGAAGRYGNDRFYEGGREPSREWVGGGDESIPQDDWQRPPSGQRDTRGGYGSSGPPVHSDYYGDDYPGIQEKQRQYGGKPEQEPARPSWSSADRPDEGQGWAQRPDDRFRDQGGREQDHDRGYEGQSREAQQDYNRRGGGQWDHFEESYNGQSQEQPRKSRWDTGTEQGDTPLARGGGAPTKDPQKLENAYGWGGYDEQRNRDVRQSSQDRHMEEVRYGNDPWKPPSENPKPDVRQVEENRGPNVEAWSGSSWGGGDNSNLPRQYDQQQQFHSSKAGYGGQEYPVEAKQDPKQEPEQQPSEKKTPTSVFDNNEWQSVLPNITIGPGVQKALSQLQAQMAASGIKLPSSTSETSASMGTSWQQQSSDGSGWQYSQTATTIESPPEQSNQGEHGGYAPQEGAWAGHQSYGAYESEGSGGQWGQGGNAGHRGGMSEYPQASRWPPA